VIRSIILGLGLFATKALSSDVIKEKSFEIELLKNKIRELEIQNEIFFSSASDVQLMYLAALAFAATFLIAFLGINIYFTKSKYEEERKLLESLFESKVIELSTLTQSEIREKSDEAKEELEESFVRQIGYVKSRVELLKKKLTEEELLREYKIVQLEIKCTEVRATKARLHIKVAVLANKLGRDSQVAESLIQLSELLSQGAKIDSLSISWAIKDLRSLPEHHEKLIEQIEKQIISSHEPAV